MIDDENWSPNLHLNEAIIPNSYGRAQEAGYYGVSNIIMPVQREEEYQPQALYQVEIPREEPEIRLQDFTTLEHQYQPILPVDAGIGYEPIEVFQAPEPEPIMPPDAGYGLLWSYGGEINDGF